MVAHKAILAASSPFFQKLLSPSDIHEGVKYDDLMAILDFLYLGEASIAQESLDAFLAIAEELQLNGLVWKTEENGEKYQPSQVLPFYSAPGMPKTYSRTETLDNKINRTKENTASAIPSNHPGDLVQLEKMLKSIMEKSQNKLPHRPGIVANNCKVCGKQGQCNLNI